MKENLAPEPEVKDELEKLEEVPVENFPTKVGVTRKNKSLSHKALKTQKHSRKLNRSKSRHKKTAKEKKATRRKK